MLVSASAITLHGARHRILMLVSALALVHGVGLALVHGVGHMTLMLVSVSAPTVHGVKHRSLMPVSNLEVGL